MTLNGAKTGKSRKDIVVTLLHSFTVSWVTMGRAPAYKPSCRISGMLFSTQIAHGTNKFNANDSVACIVFWLMQVLHQKAQKSFDEIIKELCPVNMITVGIFYVWQ